MDLRPEYIEYLKAIALGQLSDDELQEWWHEHHGQLHDDMPLEMRLRFVHGGQLGAYVTLGELGIEINDTVLARCQSRAQWLEGFQPDPMLACLRDADPCELRRFGVRCCRRRIRWLSDEWRAGIAAAERLCDGKATDGAASDANRLALRTALANHFEEVVESDNGEISTAKEAVLGVFDASALCAAIIASSAAVASVFAETEDDEAFDAEMSWQADLLRTMFALPENLA